MVKVSCGMCGGAVSVEKDLFGNQVYNKIIIDPKKGFFRSYEVCCECLREIEGRFIDERAARVNEQN